MTTRTTRTTTEATAEATTSAEPLQVREIVPFQSVRVAENQTWRGFGAVRRPAALLVVLGAVVFGAVGGGARSGAAAPSRQGWWKVGLPIGWFRSVDPKYESLVMFTSRREIMGVLVNRRTTVAAATVVAGVITAANVFLLAQTLGLGG